MSAVAIDAKATKTAAFNGASVDISAFTKVPDVIVHLQNLVGDVTISVEDSVDAFTNKINLATKFIKGAVAKPFEMRFTARDMGAMRVGTGSAVFRVAITVLTGTGKTITYATYYEASDLAG